jgi:hypothetical protein
MLLAFRFLLIAAMCNSDAPKKGAKMGYKDKMNEGIDATGSFTFEQVRSANSRVVQAMGEKLVVVLDEDESVGTIHLGFFKSGAQKAMTFSLRDLVNKDPDLLGQISIEDDGGKVEVSIIDATTSQQALLGFIPVSPKSVHGLTTYRDYLDHFTGELKAIDANASIARR